MLEDTRSENPKKSDQVYSKDSTATHAHSIPTTAAEALGNYCYLAMRTLNGVIRDLVIQVRAETAIGETVFISGNVPELGEWKVSQAVQLGKVSADGNVWQTMIHVPTNQNVQYRYLICTVVDNEGKPENIVRYWESHLRPRILRPIDYIDGKGDLDVFGYQGDSECIAKGWLTSETIVQLKMFKSPVTIWKRRYREKPISVHVSTIDITRKDSMNDIIGMEEDSTLTDGVNHRGWPIVEVAQMNDSGCQFSPQSQFGILYDPTEYVIFQIQVMNPNSIAYMVDFYVHDSDIPEHIGFCYILPSNMRDTSGTCNMPISGKRQQPIGQLSVDYLIVRPMKDFVCDLSVTYTKHWKSLEKNGLDVGHRGAGNARRNDKVENVLENTVASFNYAAKHGADMVELDVQLSKDLVPVIYHDYYICISMKKKRSQNEHELLQLAVKDLTAQQLRMLKLSPADSEDKYDFHEDDSEDNQPFPTLKHVLEAVDPRVGFNIEIKCPMQHKDGTWELDLRFEMNRYIDVILQDILENAGNRYIILSCFHPDICTMVRLKQNKYPLLFLTQGETDKYPPYLDTRTSSIPMATYFALNTGLLGIDVHAEDLIRDPSHIPFVKDRNLVLFCWGDDINHTDVIRSLKEQGVDGCIYDKVDEFTRAQENVFLVEAKARMGLLELAGENLSTWSSTSTN
ncbi:glycerophosphocholine phosphodiesterase GPCPD1 [Nephila pilipes]|uniref:Glycerophosphocholine phosphodiesterase GPCPD1 n=1 Tax=Nephila pilipes TaxID=299642 RepID=A0A8X6U6J6_NEPPI|nr:glycerophosphocholine phosphodiesterase GPCPD1 [Nephila pilipes]